MATFQSLWYRLVVLLFAIFLTVIWFAGGPAGRSYALMVTLGTCILEPTLAADVMGRVSRQWLRVPAGERALHRIAGVGAFHWLLDVSGWNRLIHPMRGFSGKRDSLLSLEQSAQAGVIGHGICFAIHLLLAPLALWSGYPGSAALWLLWPAVVVHLYPVLLQRSILLRIQPLLDQLMPAS